jgi:hypothetical protein
MDVAADNRSFFLRKMIKVVGEKSFSAYIFLKGKE